MWWKRIVGSLILACGIALLALSLYIKSKVEEGKGQIADAEKKAKKTEQLFSLSPYTQDIGKGVGKYADKKIGEGKELVAKYAAVADQMMIGGIVLIVGGVGLWIWSFGKKKKK